METKKTLYISGSVAALSSYLFTTTAFTGTIHLDRLLVFVVFFLTVMFGFEKFMDWAERFEE